MKGVGSSLSKATSPRYNEVPETSSLATSFSLLPVSFTVVGTSMGVVVSAGVAVAVVVEAGGGVVVEAGGGVVVEAGAVTDGT